MPDIALTIISRCLLTSIPTLSESTLPLLNKKLIFNLNAYLLILKNITLKICFVILCKFQHRKQKIDEIAR